MAEYANSWRSGPDHLDNWKSTAKIIEINADKGKYAGERDAAASHMQLLENNSLHCCEN